MPRVLIADKLEASGIDPLKAAGIEVETRLNLKGPELAAALREFDAAIVRSQPKITAECLENPGKLRAIARAGVGVDNIDVPAATRKGVVVMNTPGGNTVSAAEHTIALLLALARRVPQADATVKAGGLTAAGGGVIDEQALAEALAAGTIAGAGVDVFGAEPVAADNPLLKAPNVVLTPHLGASTVEAQESVAVEAAQLVADFLLR